jgi:NAD(P)H dehydrogenase (quinone)
LKDGFYRANFHRISKPFSPKERRVNVLLVYCHPRADSFCAALRDAALAGLQAAGHMVEIRDLYAEGFAAALTAEERARYYDESANRRGIEDHVASLRWAEALLLVYPTWWYAMPAMLKGWLDRVWVPGVAFRLGGPGAIGPLLQNIRCIGVVTTYGSPRWLLWLIGWPDRRLIGRGLRRSCARGCRLDWVALMRMDTSTQHKRERFLATVRERFARW